MPTFRICNCLKYRPMPGTVYQSSGYDVVRYDETVHCTAFPPLGRVAPYLTQDSIYNYCIFAA